MTELAPAAAEFERRLAARRVRIHGYLMIFRGELAAERYWPPFGPETNHRMYSVTKSFTALAAGLLVGEGRIGLRDPICKYFSDKLPPAGPHPWCAEMTIEDMLTMRTCHGGTTYKRCDGDWVESFFRVTPDHIPGTVFAYDTSSSHVLAALAERLTGMDMLDYLRRGALDALGFSKGAYILKDPAGVSQGGTGLMCTLRDVGRAAYLCLHGGTARGRELIPADFMGRATSNMVPTDLHMSLDERNGYGYFFWRPRVPGFVMYGIGGQLALCFPEADLCLVTMGDTLGDPAGLRSIYDSFYETVWPCLGLTEAVHEQEPPHIAPPSGHYTLFDNDAGWTWAEPDPDRREVRLGTPEGTVTLSYGENDGVGGRTFPGTPYPCQCRGELKAGHLILHCYVTGEEQGHVSMDFAPKDTRLSIRMTATDEPFFKKFRGFVSGIRE